MSDPQQLLNKFLKENKEDHYNFEEAHDYTVSSGSLLLDTQLGGGFGPGLHRFTGMNEGGKTSAALEVMRNFLSKPLGRRALYIKAEGRLGKEMVARSGVNFVYKAEEWTDGTCFVFESNIYETTMSLMRGLVGENTGCKYCFVLDSVDGLISKGDINKTFEESSKVAGGAVIASNMMKRISIALAKRGHMAIFTSQVRATIVIDQYTKAPVRQTSATGGNALLHFANWILEFEPRYHKDMILRNPSAKFSPENPAIGHWAKATIKKSVNEKTNMVVSYPILYGQTGGNSIWRAREVLDALLMWGLIEKKGAWYRFSPETADYYKVDLEMKFQGENKVFEYLESDPNFVKTMYDYCLGLAQTQ
jgi:RecA/RadA recombinase